MRSVPVNNLRSGLSEDDILGVQVRPRSFSPGNSYYCISKQMLVFHSVGDGGSEADKRGKLVPIPSTDYMITVALVGVDGC